MSFDYELPTGWIWSHIEEVQAKEKRATITGPFGSSIGKKFFVEKGVPVIRGNNLSLKSEKFIDNGFVFVSEDKAKELKGYKAIPLDLIFTAAGTIGQVGIIPPDSNFSVYIISNKQMRVRFDETIVDPYFAYYWFSSSQIVELIKSLDTGSTIPLINLGILRKLPLPIPPMEEQLRIKSTLLTLDDRIDINCKINKTLEEIAQAIFKSWFVDFEPTKAKIAAREALLAENPAATPEQIATTEQQAAIQSIAGAGDIIPTEQLQTIADLFPNQLVDSELGEIPEGWEASDLNSICLLNSKSWTKKNCPEYIEYVDLANTKNGVIEEITLFEWETSPSRARRILSNGDTILGTVRPGNRSFAYVTSESQLTGSTGFAVLTPKNIEWSEFLYIAATSDLNIERLAHLADGGAYPAVKPAVVTEFQLALPPSTLVSSFHSFVNPMFDKRALNLMENVSLELLRDNLLPKLIAGEMDCSDA